MTAPANPPPEPVAPAAPPPAPPGPPRRSWAGAVWSGGQFAVALAGTVAVLAYLLTAPGAPPEPVPDDRDAFAAAVQTVGPGLVKIDPASPLGRKLQVVTVRPTRVTAPVLTVTGTVVASLRPGKAAGAADELPALAGGAAAVRRSDYWQFNAPEVLTAFTDWQRATADIAFAETQLASVRDLARTRLESQEKVVAQFRRLVAAGTNTLKEQAVEETLLVQYRITGRKEVHEAEAAVALARRNEAGLARQLQQAGLAPELLRLVSSDVDIVMADVPETYLDRVKAGQGCEARFFGVPNEAFAGRVQTLAPVVSKERRSLRVLFTVLDLHDQLRPGMFAEIGLGTDARDALLAPAEGVVHVGRADYAFVGTDAPDVWRVTEVRVGEARGADAEVAAGLNDGDRVLGRGAILLKTFVIAAAAPGGGSANIGVARGAP